MASNDPFGKTDKLDEGALAALAERFEARGRHPLFASMLTEYLDAMDVDAAAKVLDLGCGTGLAARAVARRPGFAGRVTGVDLSPTLVSAAQRMARDEGLVERVDFLAADAHRLDFANGSFDAVVVHTLLSHVDDPLAVLGEAARLVKRGGLIGIFDGDYASLTFGCADPLQGKAYDEAIVGALVAQPRVMRQLPRLCAALGLEPVRFFSHVLAEFGQADFWSSAIEAYRRLAPRSGVMTGDEADAWAAALRQDALAGVFFGSCNYYTHVVRRSLSKR